MAFLLVCVSRSQKPNRKRIIHPVSVIFCI
nr:MAG TPA: hypothetical protein [Caudoviricetes sp.]